MAAHANWTEGWKQEHQHIQTHVHLYVCISACRKHRDKGLVKKKTKTKLSSRIISICLHSI